MLRKEVLRKVKRSFAQKKECRKKGPSVSQQQRSIVFWKAVEAIIHRKFVILFSELRLNKQKSQYLQKFHEDTGFFSYTLILLDNFSSISVVIFSRL